MRFTAWAPVVFRESLKENIAHVNVTEGQTLGDYFGSSFRVPCVVPEWNIQRQAVLWIPAFLKRAQEQSVDALKKILERPAADYKCLLALHVRINGASAVFWEWKQISKSVPTPEFRVAQEKVKRFIDHHVEAIQCLDSLQDPKDATIEADEECTAKIHVTSMGRSDYTEDVDYMKTSVRTISGRSRSPLEVIKDSNKSGLEEVFLMNTESALAKLSWDIRSNPDDAALERLYVGEETQTAFDYYNPILMQNAEHCRAHSMLLACVTMINLCWKHVLTSEGDVRHAFHCYMGAFVPFMYHAILYQESASDECLRPRPGSAPTMLDKFYPYDTAGFHSGDLPALSSLLDYVGLHGVQIVKDKIAIIALLMKSLPFCCQSRDLIKRFIEECRSVNGVGFWRVVRMVLMCSMAGLYPHCEKRADFRSFMAIYHMLFQDREMFMKALEKEGKDNKAKPKKERTNFTRDFIMTAFSEFFIYTAECGNSEWIKVVETKIKWTEFRENTLKSADYMRKCARFADAPRGNELAHAINALQLIKGTLNHTVYRYRKKNYTATILDGFNAAQDTLGTIKRTEPDEIILMQRMLDNLVEAGILRDEEILPLDEISEDDQKPVMELMTSRTFIESHHNPTKFNKDPLTIFRNNTPLFVRKVKRALAASIENMSHVSISLDPTIKRNIVDYLVRLSPDERLSFDALGDPRLGGVTYEGIDAMYRTHQIYMTKSSPKAIAMHIKNLRLSDLHVIAWYFNVMQR